MGDHVLGGNRVPRGSMLYAAAEEHDVHDVDPRDGITTAARYEGGSFRCNALILPLPNGALGIWCTASYRARLRYFMLTIRLPASDECEYP